MTSAGGSIGNGLIFSIQTNGTNYKDLLNFSGTNGADPEGSLILAGDTLYGVTDEGGTGDGNIFSIQTNGSNYKNLFIFNGANGANPTGSLIIQGDTLFGMASMGGVNNSGCIFSIQTNGNGYTKLFDFKQADGTIPRGALTYSSNSLYGMTYSGGAGNLGLIFRFNGTTSIESIFNSNANITIYPNPSNGLYTIEMKNEYGITLNIVVYNVLGKQIMSEKIPTNNEKLIIDLSNQLNGIYFYKVYLEDGSEIGSGKMLKVN